MVFDVTFWGVRGSRPVPSLDTLRFGGNTACVQMVLGERLFIFDSGTGICSLAQHLLKQETPIQGDIFITHSHWDHIQGFPFFTPAFQRGNSFVLYGERKRRSFASIMKGIMLSPHFPIQLDEMEAKMQFVEIKEHETLDMGDGIKVTTFPTHHPNGCLAYRVDYQDTSCCYLTDYEHQERLDRRLLSFLEGSDLIIYDAHFTNEEYHGNSDYPSRKGWGHSTWQEGIALIKACEAKRLFLFHHGTHRTDEELEEIEKQARREFSQSYAAREGMSIAL